jgi:hypothetical protein
MGGQDEIFKELRRTLVKENFINSYI